MTTIRDIIDRDLGAEISGGGVVKVIDLALLEADLREYVLTDQLAADFGRVIEPVVESARPASSGSDRIGIWVSGFFGSGKSHFAKLLGHVLADTPVPGGTARDLFERHLVVGRAPDDRVRELLQQARTQRMHVHLVPFDIMAFHAGADEHIGVVVLRALHTAHGLSRSIVIAEHETEIKAAGKWDEFLERYRVAAGVDWFEDREMAVAIPTFATVLPDVLPTRYETPELALRSLELATEELRALTPAGAVAKLKNWLGRQSGELPGSHLLLFVVDEVGAWAGRQLKRIEQVRSFVEQLAVDGKGQIWFLATSQERLSDVVQNTDEADVKTAAELLQRLTARFQTNVHIESTEVGTVIEKRVLIKKPAARSELQSLYVADIGLIKDIAETGLQLAGTYPGASEDGFVRDYPFLPYQLPVAADIFGAMRGVKVSGGARSMIKVAFDATKKLADAEVGSIVSWDRIFDSANQDNEFKDEKYLGSHGLLHIDNADRDAADAPVRASRVLKALWIAQQTPRIPCTTKNLARLLVESLDADVLKLEMDVESTLKELQDLSYVRQDAGSGTWRFLTPDEVTVERIVTDIAEQVAEKDVRAALHEIAVAQIRTQYPGRLVHGKSRTAFRYALSLNSDPIVNDGEPVTLNVHFADSEGAKRTDRDFASYLDRPDVYWTVDIGEGLSSRIRRAIAIDRLATDERFRSIATEKTKEEAHRLEGDASRTRREVAEGLDGALGRGTLYWNGSKTTLGGGTGSSPAKTRVEEALHEAIDQAFDMFRSGDREFDDRNIDRVLTTAPSQRAQLDPALAFFDADGHVRLDQPVLERVMQHLASSTKTTGAEVISRFEERPFGWPSDLVRYAATALFVDGKVALVDASGVRWDDPKVAAARALLGTGPFKKTNLAMEEAPPSGEELSAARTLLSKLGQATPDGTEATLQDAVRRLQTKLAQRLESAARADQVGLPLPVAVDALRLALAEIAAATSRTKTIRATLGQSKPLLDGAAALGAIEAFSSANGFEQYSRAMRLLDLAERSGMADDPIHGVAIRDAREQLDAIRDQRRVIDDWNGSFQTYRQTVLDAYRSTYVPLRESVRQRIDEARAAILDDPDFKSLSAANAVKVRTAHLVIGSPLAEMRSPELKSEADLLDASTTYSIAHLKATAAAIPSELARARELIAQLGNETATIKTVLWRASDHLIGRTFTDDKEVGATFDRARDEIATEVTAGNVVKIV